jgi:hypothetical protein
VPLQNSMLATIVLSCWAAVEDQPHYHRGKLQPYEIGPPSLILSSADEDRLRAGSPVMQALEQADGSRRMVMVQDVGAPTNIVLGYAPDGLATCLASITIAH